jgi:hypothetical protein
MLIHVPLAKTSTHLCTAIQIKELCSLRSKVKNGRSIPPCLRRFAGRINSLGMLVQLWLALSICGSKVLNVTPFVLEGELRCS